MEERKMFKFYKSYYDVYKELEFKDKIAFIDALFERQFYGIEPDNLKGMAKFAYISQKHNIDAQIKGFMDKTGILFDIPIQPPSIPPSIPHAIESKSKRKRESKILILGDVLSFYNSEIDKYKDTVNNSSLNEYIKYRNFLFGENKLKENLITVLGMEKQLTFEQFCTLLKKHGFEKIAIKTLALNDYDKKHYRSIYTTLINWLEI